jgi:NADPH:quinone reductase-like Zn-dependent oxidoreductase
LASRNLTGSENLCPVSRRRQSLLALTTPLLRGKRVLFPLPKDTRDDVLLLKGLVETGEFRPLIDRTFSLEQIREAYAYVAAGQKIGNVVIRVRAESA